MMKMANCSGLCKRRQLQAWSPHYKTTQQKKIAVWNNLTFRHHHAALFEHRSSTVTVSILIQKPPVPTPGLIVYADSVDFSTETTRTHPRPDRLRLQYRS